MKELFELLGHYNLQLSFNEDEKEIYVSSQTATSVLVEDLYKLKNITGAEKAEIYPENIEEDNFIIILKMEEEE